MFRRFGFIFIILLFALIPSVAFAGDKWEDYADAFATRMDEDYSEVDSIVVRSNENALETDADFAAIASDFDTIAARMQESHDQFYVVSLPPDSPQGLIEAYSEAEKGSEMVAGAARNMASSYRNGVVDEALDKEIDNLNAGIDHLDAASTTFYSFTDEYLATPSLDNPYAIVPIALDILLKATVVVGIPVILLSLYLLFAGSALNKRFRKVLEPFLNRPDKSESSAFAFSAPTLVPQPVGIEGLFRKRLAGAYGVHLVVSIVLSYVVLVFAVILMLDFALLVMQLLLEANRIPLAIVWALALIIGISLWAVVKGVFWPSDGKVIGVKVSEVEEPDLWEVSRMVAADMGTRPADEIILTPLCMVGVHESGSLGKLLLGRSKRVLAIGVPSIATLSVAEFKSILAHEYAHFSNKDTTWGPLTFRAGYALIHTLANMSALRGAGGITGILAFLNPAPWALSLYARIFGRLTSGFSRACEVMADQAAVRLYGRNNFKKALSQIVINDSLFDSEFGPQFVSMASEGKAFVDVFQKMALSRLDETEDKSAEILCKIAEEPESAYDTHPPTKQRLAYADSFLQDGRYHDERHVSALFADWQARTVELADVLAADMADRLAKGQPLQFSPA